MIVSSENETYEPSVKPSSVCLPNYVIIKGVVTSIINHVV